jgi:hypothetical protein
MLFFVSTVCSSHLESYRVKLAGIALALDPSIEIWKIAIPIILEGERRHGRVAERAREFVGFDRLMDWMTGGKFTERLAMKERNQKSIDYNLGKNARNQAQ